MTDPICKITTASGEEKTVCLAQKWPIRTPRPVAAREPIGRPLITGQRVIDTLFPIAKGGTAAIPGGFGTGKTMTQQACRVERRGHHHLCGLRRATMTQVLNEFRELIDPKSGKPMTERTVLIANTSNMPVAAREASIYTGITLADRDMGYGRWRDSTSRWGNLRPSGGDARRRRAYLPSRLAAFYERALQSFPARLSIIERFAPGPSPRTQTFRALLGWTKPRLRA